MRICLIFNPTAKGNKARRFRRQVRDIATQAELRLTTAPGEARLLAAVAVRDGCDAIVAAGGDGTVNEVLNGIGDAPDGFARVWMGVLPLGTANVFAKELSLPMNLKKAWEIILRGRTRTVDLAQAKFEADDKARTRYFAQMAGAGLDARAIELVDWGQKKKLGRFAYVVASFKALREPRRVIAVKSDVGTGRGELVLIGNGRYYGGKLPVFTPAQSDDGLLDVCIFPRVNWLTLVRYGCALLAGRASSSRDVQYVQTSQLELTASDAVPFEVEGEVVGRLPVTISAQKQALRVVVP